MTTLRTWLHEDWIPFFHFLIYLAVFAYMIIAGVDYVAIYALSIAAGAVFAQQAVLVYRMSILFDVRPGISAKAPAFFAGVCAVVLIALTLIFEGPSGLRLSLGLLGGAAVLLIATDWMIERFNMAMYALEKKFSRQPTLEIGTWGVRSCDKTGDCREVRWADLVEVGILTTSNGPFIEDMFFILISSDGEQTVVPNSLGSELLPWIQQLPDFDNMAVIEASTCVWDNAFVAWTGEAGTADIFE